MAQEVQARIIEPIREQLRDFMEVERLRQENQPNPVEVAELDLQLLMFKLECISSLMTEWEN